MIVRINKIFGMPEIFDIAEVGKGAGGVASGHRYEDNVTVLGDIKTIYTQGNDYGGYESISPINNIYHI